MYFWYFESIFNFCYFFFRKLVFFNVLLIWGMVIIIKFCVIVIYRVYVGFFFFYRKVCLEREGRGVIID